jgi:cyclopropane fatty-acyl-phospholipid synthase-like methyltransferase
MTAYQHFDPNVKAHFNASAALYRLWSPEGHLHFGYWRWPMNPFARRPMLEELVRQVVLELKQQAGARLADMGCGYGTAARWIAKHCGMSVEAFTIVEAQVQEGTRAFQADPTPSVVTMRLADFRATGLADASMDGAYGIESLCYGTGPGKQDALHEVARILKPGGRLVVADGFLMKEPRLRKQLVDTVARGWALPGFPRLDPFLEALKAEGFTDIKAVDRSWRLSVSGFHGLVLLVWTLLGQFLRGGTMTPLEKAHLRSCALGIFLGTQRDLFRYYVVSATKKAE